MQTQPSGSPLPPRAHRPLPLARPLRRLRGGGGGALGRRRRQAAWHYVSSPARFWFDAITSIPFAWIDWSVYLVRARAGAGSGLRGAGPRGHSTARWRLCPRRRSGPGSGPRGIWASRVRETVRARARVFVVVGSSAAPRPVGVTARRSAARLATQPAGSRSRWRQCQWLQILQGLTCEKDNRRRFFSISGPGILTVGKQATHAASAPVHPLGTKSPGSQRVAR